MDKETKFWVYVFVLITVIGLIVSLCFFGFVTEFLPAMFDTAEGFVLQQGG